MAFSLSIGDIVLLGSLAWKIGRAFTSGRAGAPAEFREVENELTSLSLSIKKLTDTLRTDDSILAKSNDKTRADLERTLAVCNETLEHLYSFVQKNQEIRRVSGSDGQWTWKQSVLRSYKTLRWTSQGGNIETLRDMLQMHVSSISLMVQALQSQSLARLENAVEPMSGKIDGIHDTLIGNMDVMIEEIHSRVMSWTTPGSSPALTSLSRRDTLISLTDTLVERPTRRRSSETDCEKGTTNSSPYIPSSPATPEIGSKGLFLQSVRESRSNSSCSSYPKRSDSYPISPLDFPKNMPSPGEDARGPSDAARKRSPGSNRSYLETGELTPIALPQPSIPVEQSSTQMGLSLSSAEITPQQPQAEDRIDRELINLDCVSGTTSNTADATVSQHRDFEQMVFENASILCQVTGLSVEFTTPEDDNTKRSELIQAASESRVSIVTRMRYNSVGRIRYVTSIWTLSHNRKVRMQQQLFDDVEVIPYTVWGNTTSVVICVPTELKFHDVDIKDKPLSLSKTSWVSYHFKDEESSRIFQSALMWKRLSHSYRTHRTLRVHDGIFSSFAFQEQLCGLENLRLWKDEEGRFTTAMVHYTPSFREGYLVFRLCGPGTTVSVRDDGEKWIKIKGLSVSTEPDVCGNRSPEDSSGFDPPSSPRKPITGIKIEFSTLREKYKFLEDFKHIKITR